jgi:8-oxo-dGTP diphosphatase
MKIIKLENNISWAPQPNELVLVETDVMPPLELCSSAYVLAFAGDDLLMAELDRGVDIPGGHIDPGEDAETAMRRETQEETGAIIGAASLLAVQKITVAGAKPDIYRYPYPISYQLIYLSSDFRQGAFVKDEDSLGPVMIARDKAADVPWLKNNWNLYELALRKKSGG